MFLHHTLLHFYILVIDLGYLLSKGIPVFLLKKIIEPSFLNLLERPDKTPLLTYC